MAEVKHKIIEKVPFISIRAYDDLFPINVIDVPHNCPKEVLEKLVTFSNLVIIQSWKSDKETEEFKQGIEKKPEIQIISLLRDVHEYESEKLKSLR